MTTHADPDPAIAVDPPRPAIGDGTAMNVAIARALGLDPTAIVSGGVTIRLTGGYGPEVSVTYRPVHDPEKGAALARTLARYRLVPITDPVPDGPGEDTGTLEDAG